MTRTDQPRENPGMRLAPKTVVWCFVPRRENGELVPGRTKTPVIVVSAERDRANNLLSISALYTNIARDENPLDPRYFTIKDEHQKKIMGVSGHDRAAYVDHLTHIPFETRFFGDAPEISGRVPDRLWQLFAKKAAEYQQCKPERSLRGCSVMTWSNLPPDEFAPRR